MARAQAGVAALRCRRQDDRRSVVARVLVAGKGAGAPLIHQVMKRGRRFAPSPPLDEIRRHARRELECLPEPLRQLTPGASVAAQVADDLIQLAADVDRRMQEQMPAAATKS